MIILRRVRWVVHVARIGEKGNTGRISVGKPERKRTLGRPKFTCENNFKIDLKERGQEGINWIHLAQHRDRWRAVVNTVMNLQVT